MVEECSICFEDMDESTKINKCGHTFHHYCIKEWTEINQSCPICREDTSPQFVQKISLSDNYTNIMDLRWRRVSVMRFLILLDNIDNINNRITLIQLKKSLLRDIYIILDICKNSKKNDNKYPKKPLSNRKHKIVRRHYGNLGRAVF